MKLAYIIWEDASELDVTAWTFQDEGFVYVPVLCKQVGWVVLGIYPFMFLETLVRRNPVAN